MKAHSKVVTGDYKKLPDEELIFRYVHRQEQAAVNCLFERYGHLVFGICVKYLKNSETAKDATQQIFIKLLDDLRRFEVTHFKSWLYQVTKNFCFMQLRKPLPVVNNEVVTGDMEFEDEWHQKIEQEQLYGQLEVAMEQLNEEQRNCIELFYLQRMTYAEIAVKCGYTALQVKSAIQNGKRNLKIKLEASRKVQQ